MIGVPNRGQLADSGLHRLSRLSTAAIEHVNIRLRVFANDLARVMFLMTALGMVPAGTQAF
jgi:hypothetical protein